MNTLAGALMERPKKHLSATRSLATTSVADLVRITSLHSTMDGRCTRCGYEPTIIKPLCPEAAAALRELTQRDTKPGPAELSFRTPRPAICWPQRCSTAQLYRSVPALRIHLRRRVRGLPSSPCHSPGA